jgi:PAS domain-containing protein
MDGQHENELIQEIDTLRGEFKSYQSRKAEWEQSEQECQQIDLTECKHSEETLQASETRFRSFIENSAEVIAMVDGEETLLYDSTSFSLLLGYSDEECKSQNAFGLVHTQDKIHLLALHRETIQKPSGVIIPRPMSATKMARGAGLKVMPHKKGSQSYERSR